MRSSRRKVSLLKDLHGDLRDTNCYNCLACGRCTGSCPVSSLRAGFSPRTIVEKISLGRTGEVSSSGDIWNCWACGICSEKCSLDVDFPEFMKRLRKYAAGRGELPEFPHHSMIQSSQKIMSCPGLKSLREPPRDLPHFEEGAEEVIFFRGCSHVFDLLFPDLPVSFSSIEKSILSILSHLKLKPVFLPEEKCCGHDLLWSGQEEEFLTLARHTLQEIERTGIKKIVTGCPECCYTLREEYARYLPGHDVAVYHWVELAEAAKLTLSHHDERVVYHDSCKMGRFLRIFEPPRTVISTIPGVTLIELEHNRQKAPCCGVSSWVSCSSHSKANQKSIVNEAVSKGAGALVTSCPKCLLHLNCALKEENQSEKLRIVELAELVASSLVALPVKQGEEGSNAEC